MCAGTHTVASPFFPMIGRIPSVIYTPAPFPVGRTRHGAAVASHTVWRLGQ